MRSSTSGENDWPHPTMQTVSWNTTPGFSPQLMGHDQFKGEGRVGVSCWQFSTQSVVNIRSRCLRTPSPVRPCRPTARLLSHMVVRRTAALAPWLDGAEGSVSRLDTIGGAGYSHIHVEQEAPAQ
jgi:hypothetical protein